MKDEIARYGPFAVLLAVILILFAVLLLIGPSDEDTSPDLIGPTTTIEP